MVSDCAVTFRARDVDDLREKMGRLLEHPGEVAEVAQRCRLHAERHYSWNRIVEATEAVYLDLIGGGRPGTAKSRLPRSSPGEPRPRWSTKPVEAIRRRRPDNRLPMELHAVILAGGRGERFWPLSRKRRTQADAPPRGRGDPPRSHAAAGGAAHPAGANTLVVIGADLRPAVGAPRPAASRRAQFLWEPVGRNTAAAIGAAVERIGAGAGTASSSCFPRITGSRMTRPSGTTVEAGLQLLAAGEPLVTFGSAPALSRDRLRLHRARRADCQRRPAPGGSRRFHEKPDAERARGLPRRRLLSLEQRDLPLRRREPSRGAAAAHICRRWLRSWTACAPICAAGDEARPGAATSRPRPRSPSITA